MFNKDKLANKELICILAKENKRIKRENQRLQETVSELQNYKDEYKLLIDQLSNIKKDYLNKIKEFDELEKEYRKQLDTIVSNKQRK